MSNTTNIFCRQIIEVLKGHGVKTVFCSPGSRNTPLIMALDACEDLEKHVVVDERSAAFQALGWAMVERKPVMIVCTSGTAVLDYSPAVAEAYYAGIPLIVVSADRPLEWIDQDDSQTIRQYGVLSHFVKGNYDIRAIAEGSSKEFSPEVRWTVNRTVNEAILRALEGKPGPVHINVQLSEPLGEMAALSELDERCVTLIKTAESLPQEVIRDLAKDASESKIMLVAGFALPDHKLDSAIRSLATFPNVVVMAETLANLHDPQPMSTMVDSVLCDMTEEERKQMRPDIVISIGGALVSRMLKQYLRENPPKRHWSVGYSNYFCDCFKSLTEKIEISPASFIRQLVGSIKRYKDRMPNGYSNSWMRLRQRSKQLSEDYILRSPWSDLKALDFLFRHFEFDNLFVSNGSVVRYSQIIEHKCHAEYCNRGVSGIDGSTSTAVGGALAYSGQTLLLSGDMSWIYDSGASALSNVPFNMKMVVIDNDGGGIFRLIKSTSFLPSSTLERYFCVNDLPEITAIAESYGIETHIASDMVSLEEGITWLTADSDLPRLLVVKTPAEASAKVLKDYFNKSILCKNQK